MMGYEYRVEIMGSDGTYYEDEHLGIERGCGLTTEYSCQIMTGVLGQEPYNLAQGDTVIVKIVAINPDDNEETEGETNSEGAVF